MRTTVNVDDGLLEEAKSLSNIEDTPSLLREALKALVEREARKRLSLLGGTDPNAEAPARRRAV